MRTDPVTRTHDLQVLAAPFLAYVTGELSPAPMLAALELLRARLAEATPDHVVDWPEDEAWSAPHRLFALVPDFMERATIEQRQELADAQTAVQAELARLAVVGIYSETTDSEAHVSLHEQLPECPDFVEAN